MSDYSKMNCCTQCGRDLNEWEYERCDRCAIRQLRVMLKANKPWLTALDIKDAVRQNIQHRQIRLGSETPDTPSKAYMVFAYTQYDHDL